ncbi:MAG: tetratricopeptide repeat protein [Candidatus Eisenbacteria bacterium]
MTNRKEAPKGTTRKGRQKAGAPAGVPHHRRLSLSPNALAVVAGFVAGLLYLPSLQYGWVWDDALLASTRGAGGAAAEGFRPLLSLLQRGEWMLGAGGPALSHFTNLMLHAAGTWLFFHLAIHLGASAMIAFVTALLFGAHPVHVESVAFVSGRAAMMAAVFSLASLLAARIPAVRGPDGGGSRTIWLALALYAAAAFTDASAAVTPFLLVGLDRWATPRVPLAQRRNHYAGFFAIWLASLALRFLLPAAPVATLAERGLPAGHEGAAIFHSLGTYLAMLAWPNPLNAIRSLSAGAAAAAPWLPLLPLAALVAALVWSRRHDPLARVGGLVLLLGVVPALPLPGLAGPYAAERLAYLPSVGMCLLATSILAWLAEPPRGARTAATAIGLLLAGLAAYATVVRVPVWRDNVSLLQASAAADPRDPEPYLRLAEHHAAMGDAEAALSALDRAIERDSTLAGAFSTRALALGTLGRWSEAEASARRATTITPENAEAWANLGDALTQQGKSAEAIAASRRAVELDSTQALLWYNYGVSLAATQDAEGAGEAYRRALAIDSTYVGAWNNLGANLGGQGRLEEARHAYEKAVELAPSSLQARMNLALAYLRLGDKEGAARERTVIQRMDPAAARQLAEFFKEIDRTAAPSPPRR